MPQLTDNAIRDDARVTVTLQRELLRVDVRLPSMAEISLWRFAICADPIVAAIGVSRHAPIGPEGEAPIISYQMHTYLGE